MVAKRQDRVGLFLMRRTILFTQRPASTRLLRAKHERPSRARDPPVSLLIRRWAGMPASPGHHQDPPEQRRSE
jgi:hypothetical protein